MIITKKIILSTIFTPLIIGLGLLYGNNTLVFQLKHAPADVRQEVEKSLQSQKDFNLLMNNLDKKSPLEFSKKLIKDSLKSLLTPKLSGFPCLYAGYVDISDPDGLVTFPLRHNGDSLAVVITPSVNLVQFDGNTISHCTYIADTKYYQLSKKTAAKETASTEKKPNAKPEEKADESAAPTSYWEIVEKTAKKGDKIDAASLIILTNPNNVVAFSGEYPAGTTNQCVLPSSFFVISNTNNDETLLKWLDMKSFFERISTQEKMAKDHLQQRKINNQ